MDNNFNLLLISLLNLSNFEVNRILPINNDDNVSFYVRLNRLIKVCPVCGCFTLKSIGYYKREVHLPNDSFKESRVFLEVPRYLCVSCHSSFSNDKHMAPKNKTISYKTIQKVMDLLLDPHITFKFIAGELNISESSVIRIFDKHCHITGSTFPEVICMDEIYTRNNDFKSKYACIFYDFYNHTIIDIAPCRKKNYLHHYFQSISKAECLGVKYVCIDMYRPYKDIANIYFKKAIICVDSFHVVKHLNDDLSKLRIRIMKQYDSSSIEYYLLKSWKNLLFDRTINFDNEGKYNKKLKRHINYKQLLDKILDIDSDLKKAFELKEIYMIFNSTCTLDKAPQMLDNIINEFIKSNIPEYTEFTDLLISWRNEIINSFTIYKGKRINNSIAESMNSVAKTVLSNTKGIRNHERRRKRIMYAVNKTGFSLK